MSTNGKSIDETDLRLKNQEISRGIRKADRQFLNDYMHQNGSMEVAEENFKKNINKVQKDIDRISSITSNPKSSELLLSRNVSLEKHSIEFPKFVGNSSTDNDSQSRMSVLAEKLNKSNLTEKERKNIDKEINKELEKSSENSKEKIINFSEKTIKIQEENVMKKASPFILKPE